MSSGYPQYDQRIVDRLSEAPRFNQAGRRFMQGIDLPGANEHPRRDAMRMIDRHLENINTPLPAGVEERIRQLQKMRGPVNPPENFRMLPLPPGLRQVEPDPQPEPEQPLRSVLRRDNMG